MMYYGITIGPIVETLMQARKLKELWFASYIISYVMKQIAIELNKKQAQIFLPYIDEEMIREKDKGIGLFPDRLIFKSDLSLDEIEKITNDAKESLVKKTTIANKLDSSYLKEYIQISIAQVSDINNPIQEIYPLLDTIDYHTSLTPFSKKFFDILNKDNINTMPFTRECGVGAYESLGDIAKKAGEGVASKYIAIVHADGDNLSSAVKESEAQTSKNLAIFAKEAKNILKNFATTLYMGGDDLLFLAPLRYGDATLLDKLKELDSAYKKIFDGRSTLSFGVSITYEKYPLYEALEKSRDALFGKAKKYKSKNAIAIDIHKHSGQSFTTTMGLREERFEIFNELLKNVLDRSTEMPRGVHFTLNKLKPLVQHISNEQIDNIFENFFNEEIHQKRFAQGLERTKELLKLQKESFDDFFAQISMIKLLSAKEIG